MLILQTAATSMPNSTGEKIKVYQGFSRKNLEERRAFLTRLLAFCYTETDRRVAGSSTCVSRVRSLHCLVLLPFHGITQRPHSYSEQDNVLD